MMQEARAEIRAGFFAWRVHPGKVELATPNITPETAGATPQ
jgi:hypothetical protein